MGAAAKIDGRLLRTRMFAERSLEFVALQSIADPGVVPCIVCGGHTDHVEGGVRCGDCGSELLHGADPALGASAELAVI